MNTPTGTEAGFDLDKLEALLRKPEGVVSRGIMHDAMRQAADFIALARRAAPATSALPDTTASASGEACDFCEDGTLLQAHVCNKCETVVATASDMRANIAASLPVQAGEAVDERALFEAWLRRRWPNAQRPIDEKTVTGSYAFTENNLLWEAWQVRASLAPVSAQQGAAVAVPRDVLEFERTSDFSVRIVFNHKESCDAFVNAAAKAPAAQAVPKGWQIAPIYSTGEMDREGLSALPEGCTETDAERCYKAMLAKAPAVTPASAPEAMTQQQAKKTEGA